jgi:hypothetical protein
MKLKKYILLKILIVSLSRLILGLLVSRLRKIWHHFVFLTIMKNKTTEIKNPKSEKKKKKIPTARTFHTQQQQENI